MVFQLTNQIVITLKNQGLVFLFSKSKKSEKVHCTAKTHIIHSYMIFQNRFLKLVIKRNSKRLP